MPALNHSPENAKAPSNRAWRGWLILAATFVAATIWSWRRWPNILIDFGPQFYVPWRLSEGAVLYRDVAYLPGGPFSQYWNAFLFKIFGVSFMTIAMGNLVLMAGMIALIFRHFLVAADRFTALIIGLTIILLFGFAQYEFLGNYCYVSPYSHEAYHALVLSVVAVAVLVRWWRQPRAIWAAMMGICLGLVFMTKPDIFFALGLTMAVTWISFAWVAWRGGRAPDVRRAFISFAVVLLTAFIPVACFSLYFHQYESWKESWRSVSYAFLPLLESQVAKDPYYLWCLGLDAPMHNLRWMLSQYGCVAIIVAGFAFLFRLPTSKPVNRMLMIFCVAVVLARVSAFDWKECGRMLLPLTLTQIVFLGWQIKKGAGERLLFPAVWAVFSLAMLAKLGIHGRIWHYGFVLAMPAFTSGLYFLFWLLPGLLEKRGVNRKLFCGSLLIVFLFGVIQLVNISDYHYRSKKMTIGHGADMIKIENPPVATNSVLFGTAIDSVDASMALTADWLDHNTSPQSTLAVLPEGAALNFLCRRANSSRYIVWIPPELAVFGQSNMLADFIQHPPDHVVLIHRDALEYKIKYFGQEKRYGGELMDWIHGHYRVLHQIGSEPFKKALYGIQILQRTDAKP